MCPIWLVAQEVNPRPFVPKASTLLFDQLTGRKPLSFFCKLNEYEAQFLNGSEV